MSRVACSVHLGLVGALLSLLVATSESHAGRCPNLAIIVDRSGSMSLNVAGNIPQGTELSRWQIAKNAITSLLDQYDGKLPLGVSFFPRASTSCSTGGFVVKPGYGTKTSILSALNDPNTAPVSTALTPTCGAIDAVAGDALMKDASRGQYILLVTDGGPKCTNGGGCACDACNSPDAAFAASESVRLARQQSPSIHTFVVGFGGSLSLTEKQNLNDMANEGGEPNPDANYDYYPAETDAALAMQLDKIIRTITGAGDTGPGTMLCDDSCYVYPCPTGQVCVQSACQGNPCAGVTCGDEQYCYTDGVTASCVPLCLESCGAGTRCVRGACMLDPCGGPCPSGRSCDAASKQCQLDLACANVTCKVGQACHGGKCLDDPCQYVTCPGGFACTAFEGSCQPTGDISTYRKGCSCDMTHHGSETAAVIAPLMLLLVALFAGRMRRSWH